MKKNLLTPAAVAFLALLGGIGTASAQSSSAAAAYPPGPTGQGGTTTTSNVNVVNIPTVNVGNSPTVVVGNSVIVKEAKTPISFTLSSVMAAGNDYGSTTKVYTIPAGQRLTVENLSFYCNGEPGYVQIFLYASDQVGGPSFMSGTPVLWDQYGTYRMIGNAPLRLSSDGPQMFFGFARSTSTSTLGCWGVANGYLTPIQ